MKHKLLKLKLNKFCFSICLSFIMAMAIALKVKTQPNHVLDKRMAGYHYSVAVTAEIAQKKLINIT